MSSSDIDTRDVLPITAIIKKITVFLDKFCNENGILWTELDINILACFLANKVILADYAGDLLEPSPVLADMWGQFVLRTGSYQRFCEEFCGKMFLYYRSAKTGNFIEHAYLMTYLLVSRARAYTFDYAAIDAILPKPQGWKEIQDKYRESSDALKRKRAEFLAGGSSSSSAPEQDAPESETLAEKKAKARESLPSHVVMQVKDHEGMTSAFKVGQSSVLKLSRENIIDLVKKFGRPGFKVPEQGLEVYYDGNVCKDNDGTLIDSYVPPHHRHRYQLSSDKSVGYYLSVIPENCAAIRINFELKQK